MIKRYTSLVHDRVPEILSDVILDAKLNEELAEHHDHQNIEELADLIAVIHAAAIVWGYALEELEQILAKKAAKRGKFEKIILLKGSDWQLKSFESIA